MIINEITFQFGQEIAHRCLQSAEAEIVIARVEHASRKIEARRITFARAPFDLGPPG